MKSMRRFWAALLPLICIIAAAAMFPACTPGRDDDTDKEPPMTPRAAAIEKMKAAGEKTAELTAYTAGFDVIMRIDTGDPDAESLSIKLSGALKVNGDLMSADINLYLLIFPILTNKYYYSDGWLYADESSSLPDLAGLAGIELPEWLDLPTQKIKMQINPGDALDVITGGTDLKLPEAGNGDIYAGLAGDSYTFEEKAEGGLNVYTFAKDNEVQTYKINAEGYYTYISYAGGEYETKVAVATAAPQITPPADLGEFTEMTLQEYLENSFAGIFGDDAEQKVASPRL